MLKNAIAMLLVLVALTSISVAATGCELVRVYGCDDHTMDLMANEPSYVTEFGGLDYRGNVIEENGESFVISYGVRIAQLISDDTGILTIVPMNRGKATVYYKVITNAGKTYIRYINLGIANNCGEQNTCEYSEYVTPGERCSVTINNVVMGEMIDIDITMDGNGAFITKTYFGEIESSGQVWNGIYPVTVEYWEDDGDGLGYKLGASATLNCE